MLAGIVVASILTGTLSLAVSVLSGHPPLVWPLAYMGAGLCGMLAFLLATLSRDAAGPDAPAA